MDEFSASVPSSPKPIIMTNAVITHHDVVYAGGDKNIHYLAAGPARGPLIILIHGWPGTGITWKYQIDAFAGVGFRVIAPDMPAYGKSTARRITEDYSQEALVEGMLALLKDTGRDAAIWVGHDWGSGVVSSVATQHPEVVKGLITIAVPFRSIELGLEFVLPFIDREVYPADKYEYGQWDYWRNYEENFERAIAWFEQDTAGFILGTQQPSTPLLDRFASISATARKDGGWYGRSRPFPVSELGPPMLEPEAYASFLADMEKTGFWVPSLYYMNNKRNAEYNSKAASGGRLTQPVLHVHANRDHICDSKGTRLSEPMRQVCKNLTEVSFDAGHFVHNEKPAEFNAALFRFILQELPGEWPGFWDACYTNKKSVV
ncbi:putative epoxide hydrolase [Xylaria nigripes]|nr:putative epoxide hydrolase [Xylaria nigripes]